MSALLCSFAVSRDERIISELSGSGELIEDCRARGDVELESAACESRRVFCREERFEARAVACVEVGGGDVQLLRRGGAVDCDDDGFVSVAPRVCVGVFVEGEVYERAAAYGRVLAAQTQEFARPLVHALLFGRAARARESVARVAREAAGKVSAVVRVVAALHRNLFARV